MTLTPHAMALCLLRYWNPPRSKLIFLSSADGSCDREYHLTCPFLQDAPQGSRIAVF